MSTTKVNIALYTSSLWSEVIDTSSDPVAMQDEIGKYIATILRSHGMEVESRSITVRHHIEFYGHDYLHCEPWELWTRYDVKFATNHDVNAVMEFLISKLPSNSKLILNRQVQ